MKTVTTVKVIRKFQEISLNVHLGKPDVPICEAIPQLEAEQLDEDIFTDQGKNNLRVLNYLYYQPLYI